MKKQTTNYCVVLLLIILFFMPGVVAYLFYTHPSWLSATRTNKGELLTQPVALTSIDGEGKWRIIFWSPKACNELCVQQLDTLARVRLALGRKLYDVEQIVALPATAAALPAAVTDDLIKKDFKINTLSSADDEAIQPLANTTPIFLMSPDNYLVLRYKAGVNPDDIYKDLKTLLNTTATKKG